MGESFISVKAGASSDAMSDPRYALYFVPGADTALYRFGTSVLGYDCRTGKETPFIDGVDTASWPAIVKEPKVYGFHATLKAPIRLAAGVAESDLAQAVSEFAAQHAAVAETPLALRALGSFIALVPAGEADGINSLAAECVRAFDRFRAPLTPEDRARRLASPLTARQIEYVDSWGYPYVFEEFRFHMTLTGALPASDRKEALQFLSARFEKISGVQTLRLDRIVIARQERKASPFVVIHDALLR